MTGRFNKFSASFETVLEILDAKDKKVIQTETRHSYLTDLFTSFTEVSSQVLDGGLNLMKTKSIISSYLDRIRLMKQKTNFIPTCQTKKRTPLPAALNRYRSTPNPLAPVFPT